MERFGKIVLNIPHSSTYMPKNDWVGNIDEHVRKWTDTHTDVLYEDIIDNRVFSVIFPFSRFYCDAERLIGDDLEKVGQGIVYTKFHDCERNISESERESLIKLWEWYQELIKLRLDDDTLLIDCHSFPSDVAPDVDICIGLNDDTHRPSSALIEAVRGYFEGFGYKVVINIPYSNAIAPECDAKYTSFMLEINKKLYMDDDGIPLSSMYKLKQALHYLYKKILEEWNY